MRKKTQGFVKDRVSAESSDDIRKWKTLDRTKTEEAKERQGRREKGRTRQRIQNEKNQSATGTRTILRSTKQHKLRGADKQTTAGQARLP